MAQAGLAVAGADRFGQVVRRAGMGGRGRAPGHIDLAEQLLAPLRVTVEAAAGQDQPALYTQTAAHIGLADFDGADRLAVTLDALQTGACEHRHAALVE